MMRALPLLTLLATAIPAPMQQEVPEETAAQCLKLPPASSFSMSEPVQVTGMSIVAGCGEPGAHLFIMEVLPDGNEADPEIHMRLMVRREEQKKGKLLWMESKLMRIRKARTAAGQFMKGSKLWAVLHEKLSEGGKVVPTLVLLTADQKEKTIAAKLVKFDETERFFSPFVFDLGDRVLAVWGEMNEGTLSIASAAVDPSGQQVQQKTLLVSGNLRDRFVALRAQGETTLAWLEEVQEGEDCLDLFVEKFRDGEPGGGKIAAARICADALLTGIRLSGQETLVDGMEGLKGEWRPFVARISQDFKECKVKKSKTPSAPYDADFVLFSNVMLLKKRHEDCAVSLRFMEQTWPVSADGAMSPLALSLCEKEAVGGWIEGAGGKTSRVSFFDIMLNDADADGILDDFDACPAGASGENL
jgi:hypothetical protein